MILWWSSRISDKQLFFQDDTRKMEHIYILKLYNCTVASGKKIAIKYYYYHEYRKIIFNIKTNMLTTGKIANPYCKIATRV
jgi:hypothetical protein